MFLSALAGLRELFRREERHKARLAYELRKCEFWCNGWARAWMTSKDYKKAYTGLRRWQDAFYRLIKAEEKQ